MSLARDTFIVLSDHETRIAASEAAHADTASRLSKAELKFAEYQGFLAMLDRKEQYIREDFEKLRSMLNARVAAMETRCLSRFDELRDMVKGAMNGHG